MPNCYQLSRKGGPWAALKLHDIDNEIRIHCVNTYPETMAKQWSVEDDRDVWYWDWHNVIGFLLAMGNNWDQIRAKVPEWSKRQWYVDGLLHIIDFMELTYDTNAFVEIGRRD